MGQGLPHSLRVPILASVSFLVDVTPKLGLGEDSGNRDFTLNLNFKFLLKHRGPRGRGSGGPTLRL